MGLRKIELAQEFKLYCNAYLKISWANQKIKIMFHVFQYGGWLGISPSSQAYIGGGDVHHYELTCCVLTARVRGSHLPKTRTSEAYCCKLTGRV